MLVNAQFEFRCSKSGEKFLKHFVELYRTRDFSCPSVDCDFVTSFEFKTKFGESLKQAVSDLERKARKLGTPVTTPNFGGDFSLGLPCGNRYVIRMHDPPPM